MSNNVINFVDKPKTEPEPIKMPEESLQLLKNLYVLRSYSGFEEPIRIFITRFLERLNIPFVNYNGNILGLNHPGAPLFSAHMDMVNTENYSLKPGEFSVMSGVFAIDDKTNIRLYRDTEMKKQTSLGADDKNGIWCILSLLATGKQINFAFCHSEEIGGAGSTQIMANTDMKTFISNCSYGVIIDRRNAHDIIGYDNKYCLAMDDKLEAFAKEHEYKFTCTKGSVSDADRFCKVLECVNLSCGYYNPHSSTEYTNLNELWNTYQFCILMLNAFDYKSVSAKRMGSFTGSTYSYSTTKYYGGTYANSAKDKDDYDDYYSYYNRYDKYRLDTTKSSTTSSSTGKTDASLEKKSSEESAKKTQINQSESTGSTGKKVFPLLETIPAECIAELSDGTASYDPANDVWLVPLYSDENLPFDTDALDIVQTVPCTRCNNEVALLQDAVDDLFTNYYNKRVDRCYGVCMSCWGMVDLTEDVKLLLPN